MSSYHGKKETSDNYSLRGKVFHTIREEILSGQYKQHEELKENTIAQELGVSRTPVREALRQLELEGLVEMIPNKGAYVTGISAKDVEDIYMVRSLLEGLCAKWATEHITEEQMEELDETLCLSEFHAQKEHFDQMFELDNRFHEILYEASGSNILQHVLSDFHHYVQRVRKISLGSKKRALESNKEHEMIVDAMKAGDAEKAEALANQHIMNTIANLEACKITKLLEQMK